MLEFLTRIERHKQVAEALPAAGHVGGFKHAGDPVLHMSNLPIDVDVQFMTIMATKMPFVERGSMPHAVTEMAQCCITGRAARGRQPLRLPRPSAASLREARRDRQRSSSIPRGNPDQGLNTKPGLIATSAGMGCRSENSAG